MEHGTWLLRALVDSHSDTWSLGGHMISAVMYPRYGSAPEWHFAGVLVQTGSGYVSATGTVDCR